MSDTFRSTALIAGTVTTGLIAGIFYAYSTSVMLALGRTDDRTFVDVMNKINVDIINPWFMVVFLGSGVFSIVALLLNLGADQRKVMIWVAAAVVFNIVALIITMGFNVPLNDGLATVGDSPSDLAEFRERFEVPWVRLNIARTVGHTAAFGCLTWALILHGRVSHAA